MLMYYYFECMWWGAKQGVSSLCIDIYYNALKVFWEGSLYSTSWVDIKWGGLHSKDFSDRRSHK